MYLTLQWFVCEQRILRRLRFCQQLTVSLKSSTSCMWQSKHWYPLLSTSVINLSTSWWVNCYLKNVLSQWLLPRGCLNRKKDRCQEKETTTKTRICRKLFLFLKMSPAPPSAASLHDCFLFRVTSFFCCSFYQFIFSQSFTVTIFR